MTPEEIQKRATWLETQIDVLASAFEKQTGTRITAIEAKAIDCTTVGDKQQQFYRGSVRVTYKVPA